MRPSEFPGIPRLPGAQVAINGELQRGVIAANVRSNNYFSADHFDVAIALNADQGAQSDVWWQTSPMSVDLQFRLDASAGYCTFITGTVDLMSYDPIGGIVRLEGRDQSSRLIDTPMSETFSNRTASEIAILLAQRHALIPCVAPTTRIVGRYYHSQHDALTLDRFASRVTEWDFLAFLAQQESFDLFVQGSTLHFQPASDRPPSSRTYYPSDLIRLRCQRMPVLSSGVEVTVRSWSSLDHMAVSETVTNLSTTVNSATQLSSVRYLILQPNLTSDSARQIAERKLKELRRHCRSIELLMPADLTLAPRDMIFMNGTNSDFDQTYQVEMIERRFSSAKGFVQLVRAGNVPSGT